ncbi:hypothetical protein BKA69DRAFT_1034879 [Paraphysoderma sedebokerense]|nr:hypothetical protein BKA69DRAFT_1034879 [Paraphysoderma sedebokerense]
MKFTAFQLHCIVSAIIFFSVSNSHPLAQQDVISDLPNGERLINGKKIPGNCPPSEEQIIPLATQIIQERGGNTGANDREQRIQQLEAELAAIQRLKCPAVSVPARQRELASLTGARGKTTEDNSNASPPRQSNPGAPGAPASPPANTESVGGGSPKFTPPPVDIVDLPNGERLVNGKKVPGNCPPSEADIAPLAAKVLERRGGNKGVNDREKRIQELEAELTAIQELKCPAASVPGRKAELELLTGQRGSTPKMG